MGSTADGMVYIIVSTGNCTGDIEIIVYSSPWR